MSLFPQPPYLTDVTARGNDGANYWLWKCLLFVLPTFQWCFLVSIPVNGMSIASLRLCLSGSVTAIFHCEAAIVTPALSGKKTGRAVSSSNAEAVITRFLWQKHYSTIPWRTFLWIVSGVVKFKPANSVTSWYIPDVPHLEAWIQGSHNQK